jgi:hypothetical protein
VNNAQRLDKLQAFKQADKYKVFGEVQDGISFTAEDQQKIINQILDNCCNELTGLLRTERKPLKTTLKKIVSAYMDVISLCRADEANKDFAYELCFYLSEIAGLQLKLLSEGKAWGYWKVAADEVKIVKKKKSKTKNKEAAKGPVISNLE